MIATKIVENFIQDIPHLQEKGKDFWSRSKDIFYAILQTYNQQEQNWLFGAIISELVNNIGFISNSTHTSSCPKWYKSTTYEYPSDSIKKDIRPKFSKIDIIKIEKICFHKDFILKRFTKKCIEYIIRISGYKRVKALLKNIYITFIRYLDGEEGKKLRYSFYKKRLKYLGRDAVIDTGVYISGEQCISIGDNTHIDKNCILIGSSKDLDLSYRYLKKIENTNYKNIKGEISIGKECHISQNAMIYGYGGVSIGNNSVLSAGAKIYSLTSMAYNPYNKDEVVSIVPYSGKSPTLIGSVVLGNNVWIGLDSVISPGVTLKDNSFAKSQSIINSSFNENSYIGGSPAVYIRKRYDN